MRVLKRNALSSLLRAAITSCWAVKRTEFSNGHDHQEEEWFIKYYGGLPITKASAYFVKKLFVKKNMYSMSKLR